jgi:hypothetical protein
MDYPLVNCPITMEITIIHGKINYFYVLPEGTSPWRFPLLPTSQPRLGVSLEQSRCRPPTKEIAKSGCPVAWRARGKTYRLTGQLNNVGKAIGSSIPNFSIIGCYKTSKWVVYDCFTNITYYALWNIYIYIIIYNGLCWTILKNFYIELVMNINKRYWSILFFQIFTHIQTPDQCDNL